MLLAPFKSLIREKCGLSFEDSREVLLAEGIKTRLSERAVASHDAYLALLFSEPDEFNRLVNLITVKETYFFREAVHFKILTETLIPELWSETKNRRIRIVCAGCSTGEEPYSIAIALAERFGPEYSSMFSVVGFDIDEEALCRARAGVYAGHSFRGIPEHIQRGFFHEQGNGFRINNAIRRGVEFLRLNLFVDSFPDTVRNADIIFYRNVSIYFESDAQKRIFSVLAGMLNDKGYLFLSSAETFAHNSGILSLIEKEGVFLYVKGLEIPLEERRKSPCRKSGPAAPLKRERSGNAGIRITAERTTDTPQQIFDRALSLAEIKRYEDALLLAEMVISMQPSHIKAHMLRAGILINLQRPDEAEIVCSRSIELDPWCLEGHLLLGLIARLRGDVEDAKKRFNEAVYIRSSCWLAHFYLGEIYRSEGDIQHACREFEIVIKLLGDKGLSDHGLTFFSLSFTIEQVIHLCRHNLITMKRSRD